MAVGQNDTFRHSHPDLSAFTIEDCAELAALFRRKDLENHLKVGGAKKDLANNLSKILRLEWEVKQLPLTHHLKG